MAGTVKAVKILQFKSAYEVRDVCKPDYEPLTPRGKRFRQLIRGKYPEDKFTLIPNFSKLQVSIYRMDARPRLIFAPLRDKNKFARHMPLGVVSRDYAYPNGLPRSEHNYRVLVQAYREYMKGIKELQEKIQKKFSSLLEDDKEVDYIGKQGQTMIEIDEGISTYDKHPLLEAK